MDKKRRYDIPTNVRIPDMEEIRLAAANFTEPPEADDPKSGSGVPAVQRVRRVPKYEAQLSSIKTEMEQLANKVAIEEEEKEAAEAALAESSDEAEETAESLSVQTADEEAKPQPEEAAAPLSDPLLESVAAVVKTTMDKKKTEDPKKTRNKK